MKAPRVPPLDALEPKQCALLLEERPEYMGFPPSMQLHPVRFIGFDEACKMLSPAHPHQNRDETDPSASDMALVETNRATLHFATRTLAARNRCGLTEVLMEIGSHQNGARPRWRSGDYDYPAARLPLAGGLVPYQGGKAKLLVMRYRARRKEEDEMTEGRKPKPEKLPKVKGASRMPRWMVTGAAAKGGPHERKMHREYQLGTLGPASKVRRIDPKTGEVIEVI